MQRSNAAALFAVVLTVLPPLLGTGFYGDQTWWWLVVVLFFGLFQVAVYFGARKLSGATEFHSPVLQDHTMKEATMRKQSRFELFYGTLVSALAFLTTGVVAAFFYFTFWMGEVIDLSLQLRGVTIPPESYPIILLTAWTLLQRAKAHWRPRDGRYGQFWWGEDLLEAFCITIFIGVTLVWAIATNTNLTFVVVMIAFLAQSIGDALLNGRHRYEEELFAAGAVAGRTAAGPTGSEAGVAEIPAPHRFV